MRQWSFWSEPPKARGSRALQSLLGAGNVDMTYRVLDEVMKIEPMESGVYVLMSNLYARKGHCKKVVVVEIRKEDEREGSGEGNCLAGWMMVR